MGKILDVNVSIDAYVRHKNKTCSDTCFYCKYDSVYHKNIELEKERELHGRISNAYFRRKENDI